MTMRIVLAPRTERRRLLEKGWRRAVWVSFACVLFLAAAIGLAVGSPQVVRATSWLQEVGL